MPSVRQVKSLTLLAMCLGLFMPQLDTNVVNLALPSMQSSLHTDIGALQWIIDSYNLTFASLLLLGGTLGDLFGRKRLFLIGLALFTGGSLICAFAGSIALLLVGRVLQGIGAALELPGTLSILTATYPDPKERARAIGIWASVMGLALAIGPTVGALFVNTFGWQSIFFMNIPIGLINFGIAAIFVAESSHPQGRRLDLPGQTLAILCLVALTYAVIEGQARGWFSPLILAGFGLAIISLAAFIIVERRTPGAMVPLDIFRHRAFSAALAIASMMTFGMYGMFFLISLYLQSIHHASALLAGLQLLPLSIVFIIISPPVGRWISRFGPRPLMVAGMALMGVGLLLFTLLTPETPYTFLVITMAAIGAGVGLNTSPVMAVAVGSLPARSAGLASGFGNMARMIGATLGVAILGAILAGQLSAGHGNAFFMAGLHTAFLVGGCGELLGAVLAILYIPRMLQSETADERAVDRAPTLLEL
ncbi:DHA2 family efflux MFS transporter permease subunit [Ktedonosporobacter rubrisoli]|uniref:DHA2 family efflux MFS transporter permease subunit n=1 Tax=Ktedonosporobacter rubrisoli TaxID=2509675 RepID=A0A4P6K055_KTERU|nr:MFS transporter [Ktedonosporobacter rubrisoli]QBD81419.1 DHA2 family efflux MFS transporter permease subunit [Ktedonosporobacter rubrisoli]